MDVREKLVELLRNSPHLDTIKGYKGDDCTFEQGADWLIANGVTVQEWIPVKDRLPDVGKLVLIYNEINGACLDYHDGVTFSYHYVTHWMPLPPPPKGE